MLSRKIIILIFSMLIGIFVFADISTAQTKPAQAPISLPFTADSLKAEIKAISEDGNLADEDKQQIADLYNSAISKLAEGKASKAQAEEYAVSMENAPTLSDNLERETVELREFSRRPRSDMMAAYKEQKLEELEQNLVQEQAKLNTLRGLKSQYEDARRVLDTRPAQALEEIAVLEQEIAERAASPTDSETEPSRLERAANALKKASLYADRYKKRALEQEIASIAARRNVLDKRISLTAAQISSAKDLVSVLSERTGSARTDGARQRLADARKEAEEFTGDHPMVQAYALANVELAQRNLDIANSEGDLPDVEKSIDIMQQQVRLDAGVTEDIIKSKRFNRSYGAHLRSLRKNQPNIATIQQAIKARELDLQDALFQRITTQEDVSIFDATPFNITQLKQAYDSANNTSPELSETDIEHLQRAYDSRRGLLNELASVSSLRARKLEEVNAKNRTLLKEVKALCAKLDSRLLWLPSTETIGLSWPGKVVQGFAQSMAPANLAEIGRTFIAGIKNAYFLVFLALGFLAALHILRDRIKPVMAGMGSRVGRVQKDSYSLTMIAIFDGLARATIISGILVVFGIVFALSGVNSQLANNLARTCFVIAGPLFVFSAIKTWSRKGALFDLHFKVDRQLRQRLRNNIPWLMVVIAISIFLSGVTGRNMDFDSGKAALAVFGFILGAVALAWFSIRLAWARSKVLLAGSYESEGIYMRNERWFMMLGIIVPFATALLAVFGYFETAQLLLSRFFVTFCILITAYVAHGLFKRTLIIAQRRLALEQARARRDRAVKERMEKAAAEERGEIAVPRVDTESIDLETINRQSKQLINITVFVATIGALWALWGSILPALSIFDEVQLGSYMEGTDKIPITLWNVMQALGIGLITWLAARNLPGFLEMFVLKRFNMAQSTRFAITTVLGYIIFIIGIWIAFDKLGTQWSQFQWIVAAFGVGIGFGLQAIFANFISGLIILFERPVRIGDYVTVGDISGTVTRIQIRATTLLDLDNKEILIPNQELVTQQVTNWTLANPVTRLIINVGIAYGSDTNKAHHIMLSTIKKNAHVLNNPEPTVLFLGFGASSLDFELRVFLRDFTQRFIVSHELHMAIDAALRKADIEIAFPQRDLHIKNPDALQAIVNPTEAKPKRSRMIKPKTS